MFGIVKRHLKKARGYITAVSSNIRGFRAGSLIFQCNVCSRKSITSTDKLGRETISCLYCGSTVRMRMIVHALSSILFGESLVLRNFPIRPDIRVLGLSDWDGYAVPLANKLAYTNTFYHQEPKLDITSINPSLGETLDVLISSDVFEHVAPPIHLAFENAYRLLKPGGVLIFTVPYSLELDTKEHFPELFQYEIRRDTGKPVLYNITRDGREQVFDKLNFHGGAGETLEMRLFSLDGIKHGLKSVGFQEIDLLDEPCFRFGIYLRNQWSLPVIARKP